MQSVKPTQASPLTWQEQNKTGEDREETTCELDQSHKCQRNDPSKLSHKELRRSPKLQFAFLDAVTFMMYGTTDCPKLKAHL